ILADYDHKDWNAFLEYPTVENICELVSKRLHEKIKFPMHVRIWEGHGKWAEIRAQPDNLPPASAAHVRPHRGDRGRGARRFRQGARSLFPAHRIRLAARPRGDFSGPRPVRGETRPPEGRGRLATEGGTGLSRPSR